LTGEGATSVKLKWPHPKTKPNQGKKNRTQEDAGTPRRTKEEPGVGRRTQRTQGDTGGQEGPRRSLEDPGWAVLLGPPPMGAGGGL
jgi:hypothetical protein